MLELQKNNAAKNVKEIAQLPRLASQTLKQFLFTTQIRCSIVLVSTMARISRMAYSASNV